MVNLDLHVEFQPQDDLLCTIDHATRECNGVKLTADNQISDGRLTKMQAAKFKKVGDFNYLVYVSKNHFNLTSAKHVNQREIMATLQVYTSNYQEPAFSIDLPTSSFV